ncbi:MAG: TrmB family transcriptional regulator [Promethearchaeota archaeon]
MDKRHPSDIIKGLKRLGLTEYEAEVYATLLRLGSGTASEISNWCHVPQSRIYDTIKSLSNKELVEIQPSRPRRFRPTNPERALASTVNRLKDEMSTLIHHLSEYYQREKRPINQADLFWLFKGKKELTHKTEEMLANIKSEVLIIAQEFHHIKIPLLEGIPNTADIRVASYIENNSKTHAKAIARLKRLGALIRRYNKRDLWLVSADRTEVLIATPSKHWEMIGVYTSRQEFINVFNLFFEALWNVLPAI